jgi:hypothetical protein
LDASIGNSWSSTVQALSKHFQLGVDVGCPKTSPNWVWMLDVQKPLQKPPSKNLQKPPQNIIAVGIQMTPQKRRPKARLPRVDTKVRCCWMTG